jgi:DNA-binding MarR family transcriptional regulator
MSSFDPQYREDSTPGHVTVTLYRISQAVSVLLRDRSQAQGLSATQLQALLFLAYARHDVRTIGGLAERLGCTPATASGVANALERKGLAIRKPWPQHRRTIMLNLTDDGMAMVDQVDSSLDDLEAIVRQLSAEEQEVLLRLTEHVVQGLAKQGWIKLYEMCWKCEQFQSQVHPGDPDGPHHCGYLGTSIPDAESYKECPDFLPLKEVGI